MRHAHWRRFVVLASLIGLAAGCSDGPAPTRPSPTSFLAGRWDGTLTIEPRGQAPSTGPTSWTFEAVPQTNLQSFNATIRSENPWLPITLEGVAAIAPSAPPPTQISTQGDFTSPRGCRGTFGSFGTAQATRIEASFHGVDCDGSFDGTVVLTKVSG